MVRLWERYATLVLPVFNAPAFYVYTGGRVWGLGDLHYGAETLYYTAPAVGVVHLKSLLYSQGDVRLPARLRQLLKEKATLALSRCITHRAMSLSAGGCRCVFGEPHYINFLPLVILSTRVSQRCVLLEFVNKKPTGWSRSKFITERVLVIITKQRDCRCKSFVHTEARDCFLIKKQEFMPGVGQLRWLFLKINDCIFYSSFLKINNCIDFSASNIHFVILYNI